MSALPKIKSSGEDDLSPQSLGMIFKSARVKQGKKLEAISEQLKIRRVFLDAIEKEQFDQLPGGVYTVGFIRSYARYLNLDHSAIIDQLKEEKFLQPISLNVIGDSEHFPTTRFVPKTMIMIGASLLIFCLIAAYLFFDDLPAYINWPNLKPAL